MNQLAEVIDKYTILRRYKSNTEKQAAVDHLIGIIVAGKLPPDELEEAKEEAVILAESLLRCSPNKQDS